MIFATDKVTSENHWQITSRVTKKIIIHGSECIILFLTSYFMPWTHNSTINNNQLLILQWWPRMVCSDLELWRHTTVDLWRQMNARYCDVKFVDCFCTRKRCKGNLHWWITTVNIDFSPPGIRSLYIIIMSRLMMYYLIFGKEQEFVWLYFSVVLIGSVRHHFVVVSYIYQMYFIMLS